MRNPAKNNFSYLFGGLLLLFLLPPSLRLYFGTAIEEDVARVSLLVGFSLFSMISVWSLYQNRWIFYFGLALVLLNIAIAVAALFFHSFIWELCASVSVILFAVLSCFIAGRHVFSFRDTNANSLIGAICVYLLLGLIWAIIYVVFMLLAAGCIPRACIRWQVFTVRQYFIFQLCDADHRRLWRYHALESIAQDCCLF